MKNLSVAIAAFNEEENIARCLKSVISFADEIVLVDGSSSDKTVAIAKKFKVKVIIADNPKIFHINKQKAINICSSKWILQLDADEIVTDDLKDEILAVISKQSSNSTKVKPKKDSLSPNGYWIPRKNFFLGRFLMKGGQYPDYTLRLYKRGKGRLPCKSVHEQAVVTGKTGYLVNPLEHFPYPDFYHYLEHFDLYTDIFASEMKEGNTKINLVSLVEYLIIKPVYWFGLTYFRHKGLMDGYQGLVFSFFSSLRFPASYIKFWKKTY